MLFTAKEISKLNTNDSGKKVKIKITLNNVSSDGSATNEMVEIPDGTIVKINGKECIVQNNEIIYTIIDSLSTKEYSEKLELKIDMSNVETSKKLSDGTYSLKAEAYIASVENVKNTENAEILKEILIDNAIAKCEKQIQITKIEGFGIMVSIDDSKNISGKVTSENSANKQNTSAQIITETEGTTRTVNITYQKGTLGDDVYIKAKTYKKDKDGNYVEQTTNFANIDKITNLSTNNTIKKTQVRNLTTQNSDYKSATIQSEITFAKGVESGTYRIEYSLCDGNGETMTKDFINFIVK